MNISPRLTRTYRSGFTLVEMMVIIAILGILVSLSAFGYRGWQTGLSEREAQSDLRMAASAMESAKNFGAGYPTSLPSTFKSSDKVTVSLVWGDKTKFCLGATSTRTQNVNYYILNGSDTMPQSGICPSAPFPPAAPTPSAVATSSAAISVTWPAVQNATGYTVSYGTGTPTTQASCSGSPCAISGLSASTTYTISVTANNSYGSSPAGTTSVATQAPPIPGATSPSIASQTTNSLTVSWPAVTSATCYVVRYGTGTPASPTGCVSSPYAINGLSSGTTYNVSVTASNSNGSGAAGTTSGTTLTPPPPTPSNPSISYTGPVRTYGGPGGSTPYNTFTISAASSSCSSGTLEWKIITSLSWTTTGTWQTGNTATYNQIATGASQDRTYNAKPRCVIGAQATEHPGYASVTIPGCPDCR